MENRIKDFEDVLISLFYSPFSFIIKLDENRVDDGLALRARFEDLQTNSYFSNLKDECSVLEMFIALAERMGFITMTLDENEPPTAYCFWEIIDNLKLKPGNSKNKEIVEAFIHRKYDYYGRGGIFPIIGADQDQRLIEIWYQMMSYLNLYI